MVIASAPSLQCFVCQKAHYGMMNQRGVATYPLAELRYSIRIAWGKKILATPAGLAPLLRWARGPLPVPYRPGTPAYKLQNYSEKQGVQQRIVTCPGALGPVFLYGRALVFPCIL
jgi:hypothetical protein